MNLNNKKKIVGTLLGITFIFSVILFFMNKVTTGYLLILLILLYVLAWIYIYLLFFNGEESFNSYSLFLYIAYIAPLAVLLVPKWIVTQDKFEFGFIAVGIIGICSLCLWGIYFARCRKVIIDIKQDKYLFLARAIKSILTSVLVWLSGVVIILSHFAQNGDKKIAYEIFNILINTAFSFIDMYTYVRSTLNKHMKDSNIPIKIKSHSD